MGGMHLEREAPDTSASIMVESSAFILDVSGSECWNGDRDGLRDEDETSGSKQKSLKISHEKLIDLTWAI